MGIEQERLESYHAKGMTAFYREASFLLQRFNFFLVATSFLITGLVVVATKTDPEAPLWLRRWIVILGCGISSFFFVVNFRNSDILKRFRDYVFDVEKECEPVRGLQPPFKQILPELSGDRRLDRFPLPHTWVVPLALFVFWSFCSLYSGDSEWFTIVVTAVSAALMLLGMAWQRWIRAESLNVKLGGEVMRGKLSIIVVMIVLVLPLLGYAISKRADIRPADWMEIAITSLLVMVTCFYAWSAFETLRQATQSTRASLDAIRQEHNWKLWENHVDPGLPGLPPHDGNEEYWRWRIVHLDHLNLLMTQWQGWRSKAVTQDEMKAWQSWVGLLLGELKSDRSKALERMGIESASARQIMEFKDTPQRLKALLHISERHNWDMFPADFVRWLRDECQFGTLGLSAKSS